MCSPLISVVMPVYNVEKYLEAALKSVENQTYKNIEVILINDGSSDNSLSIAQGFKERSTLNIKIFSQNNRGVSSARNKGLSLATGKYIYFFDSDDLIDSNMIESVITTMEMYQLDAVRFNAEIFYDQNEVIYRTSLDQYRSNELKENYLYNSSDFFRCQLIIPCSVCIYVFRTSILRNNNVQFYEGIIHEDELFTPVALANARRIMYLNNDYFKRRYRPNSIMTQEDSSRKHAIGYLTVIRQFICYSNTNSIDVEVKKYYEKTINRLGTMIFGSGHLKFIENLYLINIGINPIYALYLKFINKVKQLK
ncbi:MAG: glycosyltransferase [Facklamia hominis]